jgi:hypothetical protein
MERHFIKIRHQVGKHSFLFVIEFLIHPQIYLRDFSWKFEQITLKPFALLWSCLIKECPEERYLLRAYHEKDVNQWQKGIVTRLVVFLSLFLIVNEYLANFHD